jgi:hypothetical protein
MVLFTLMVMISRETVKSTVFGMGIAPPTMSLDEFGDLQKQEAEERAAREAAAPPGTRKYASFSLEVHSCLISDVAVRCVGTRSC